MDDIKVQPILQPLYDYLASGEASCTWTTTAPSTCRSSAGTCSRIATGDESWETMVPEAVADLIKQKSFFDYSKVRVDED